MNLYIKAMEIGYLKDVGGISYHDLKSNLMDDHNFDIGPEREFTFLVWFLENFKCHRSFNEPVIAKHISMFHSYLLRGENPDSRDKEIYDTWLNQSFFLTGQATKQYLDYIELQEARTTAQEARESSNKALKVAQWSLIAAILAALLPFGHTIYKESKVNENPVLVDNYTELTTEETPLYEPEQLKVSKDMKLDEFVQLSQLKQYEIVFNEGIYVDDIREEKQTFALYSVGTFWVEVTYDRQNNKILRLKPFEDGELLDKFTID